MSIPGIRGTDPAFINNIVPDNYANIKMAFLHPSKLHVSKNLNMAYDRTLLKWFMNHLCG